MGVREDAGWTGPGRARNERECAPVYIRDLSISIEKPSRKAEARSRARVSMMVHGPASTAINSNWLIATRVTASSAHASLKSHRHKSWTCTVSVDLMESLFQSLYIFGSSHILTRQPRTRTRPRTTDPGRSVRRPDHCFKPLGSRRSQPKKPHCAGSRRRHGRLPIQMCSRFTCCRRSNACGHLLIFCAVSSWPFMRSSLPLLMRLCLHGLIRHPERALL
jgi:hypothetical protein